MNMPPMVSPDVVSRLRSDLDKVIADLRAFRSSSGTLGSATIYKGDLKLRQGGSLSVEDGGGINMGPGGRYVMFGDDTYVQILDDSFSIGTIDPVLGFTWPSMQMLPDGFLAAISSTQYAVFKVDEVDGAAIITSSTGVVRLPYQTTSSSANTRILLDGTIQLVNSSRRYKADTAAAVVDVDDVLRMQGRTWVDKATMERLAEAGEETDIPRDVGFIAEELDALPSLRQFVDYDDQGRPDAIQYDRLTVPLLELAKTQQAQLADQQTQIAGLSARLDALDGGAPSSDADPQE